MLPGTAMRDDEPTIQRTCVACTACGYDLSGTAVGGACPECGRSVILSLPRTPHPSRPPRPRPPARVERRRRRATLIALLLIIPLWLVGVAYLMALTSEFNRDPFEEMWSRRDPSSAQPATVTAPSPIPASADIQIEEAEPSTDAPADTAER